MMLGFKQQFAAYIREGSKRHTIRGRGGRKWAPGVIADCFVNPRQKTMECLGRWPVVKVDDIRIELLPMAEWVKVGDFVVTAAIEINGERLCIDEAAALAWRDGFRTNGRGPGAFVQMLGFWKGRLPFHGDLIHWDYDRPAQSAEARNATGRPAGRPRRRPVVITPCTAVEVPHDGRISHGRCVFEFGHEGQHSWGQR